MDASVVDEPVQAGLQVHFDAEPMMRASELADELHGDLCATRQEAEHVLRQLGAYPPLDADGIANIKQLSERVAAAQRILERTVDRAARDVGDRLAAVGTGLAIHPTTVRERAAAVLAARDRLREAAERLVEAEAQADADEAAAAAAADEQQSEAPATGSGDPSRPVRRGLFGRGRAARARRDDDTTESTLLLQQVAAATDEAFGIRRAHDARADALLLLTAQRDRAREDLRVAHRAWHDLAGESNVEDVEEVVRRFDPQLQEAREVAQDAIGVRAVSTLLQQATERWAEGWRSLGQDPPASVDHEWVESMARRMTRPVVLVADATALGERFVDVAPAAPVLVVEPAS